MDFGRRYYSSPDEADTALSSIDFSLPEVSDFSIRTLSEATISSNVKLNVGSSTIDQKKSGFSLAETADLFDFVDFAQTFYQIVSAERVRDSWAAHVKGTSFRFFPKLAQNITHIRRFKNTEEVTQQFLHSLEAFGDHLGGVIIQTPDNARLADKLHLIPYLDRLPKNIKFFVEIRNKAWLEDKRLLEETFAAFKELGIGTVLTDTMYRRDALHMNLTTPALYIRFNGNDFHNTDKSRLTDWVQRIAELSKKGLQAAYLAIHTPNLSKLSEYNKYLKGLREEYRLI